MTNILTSSLQRLVPRQSTCALPRYIPRDNVALQFSVSATARLKEIKHIEEKDKIIVKAEIVESSRSKVLVDCSQPGSKKHCHPFCLSPIVGQVKHTDVLILDQFIDSKGEMISREDLGICRRQWTRLHKLVQMAQRAGLMPGKEFYCAEYRKTKWGANNCYWDEKTIDIQWNRNVERSKAQAFKSGFFKD